MVINSQNQISMLRASVTEGRSENVRYRQDQLYALHAALRESSDVILLGITKDSSCYMQDAETEFYLGMDALRSSYESLNFEKSLKDEYLVANGKSNTDRRVALGVVTIRPSKHSRFYSVVVPLAAALVAGNCILLELDGSSPSLDNVLDGVLAAALDQDTFQIGSTQIDAKHFSEFDVLVDQTGLSKYSSLKTLVSPQFRSIAIVDRSTGIELAAKEIVDARISSRSNSPYSPDLVIVNEFIAEAFVVACLKDAGNRGVSPHTGPFSAEEKQLQNLIEKQEKEAKIKIHRSSNTDLAVVEILDRKSPLAQMKIDSHYIILLPSRGLVDSVDSQRSSAPFLVSYLFASLAACKFLSEQLSSHATYINHIPTQLLIGPASPLDYAHHLHPRYTPDMFSSPRPQFVTPPESLPATTKLKELALKKLLPTGQRPGHAVGFFEQGILIGLGSTALLVLPLIGWSLFVAGKQGWKFVGPRIN